MNPTGPDAKYLRLYLSAKMGRIHVSNISTKLQVANRARVMA